MNDQNQPIGPANSTKPKLHVVPADNFYQWTLAWSKQVANIETLWKFFEKNEVDILKDRMVKKIFFTDETVQNLLSSVGVQNINARFAIVDEYKPYGITKPTFTIIMYGIDNQGQRCSAYHIGEPQYNYLVKLKEGLEIPDIGDNISGVLAKRWINDWKVIINDAWPFPEGLFASNYGFLTGYNYLMADFMYALYPPDKHIINYDVVVLLAAHRHIAHHIQQINHQNHDDFGTTLTFGLVVAGVELSEHSRTKGDQQVNSYYDLSLPCPPNQ